MKDMRWHPVGRELGDRFSGEEKKMKGFGKKF